MHSFSVVEKMDENKSNLRKDIVIIVIFIVLIGLGLLCHPHILTGLYPKLLFFAHQTKGPKITVYDLTQPTHKNFKCVNTSLKPSTKICLYNKKEDIYISRVVLKTGHYQGEVVAQIVKLLEKNPEYGFFDIGANIGMHTLTIAKMGRKVVAVEPNIRNVQRLHRAAELSGTTCYITMVTNGISDVRENASLVFPVANFPGLALVAHGKNCTSNCVQRIETVLMDDLLPVVPFKSAIMKIDIEGFEFRAFAHAEKLLTAIDIPYIIMEWVRMQMYHLGNEETRKMILKMVKMLTGRGYGPFETVEKKVRLNPANVSQWPHDIVWIKGC